MQTITGKILASVFWDMQSITLRKEEPLIVNIIWHYRIKKKIMALKKKKKKPRMKKNVPFHQDNAPCHILITTIAKLPELHFELLLHSLYSLDLAPSDYWLLADLKRMLQGKRFSSNEEVILETEVYFVAKDK